MMQQIREKKAKMDAQRKAIFLRHQQEREALKARKEAEEAQKKKAQEEFAQTLENSDEEEKDGSD
jgi:hypothetical protein